MFTLCYSVKVGIRRNSKEEEEHERKRTQKSFFEIENSTEQQCNVNLLIQQKSITDPQIHNNSTISTFLTTLVTTHFPDFLYSKNIESIWQQQDSKEEKCSRDEDEKQMKQKQNKRKMKYSNISLTPQTKVLLFDWMNNYERSANCLVDFSRSTCLLAYHLSKFSWAIFDSPFEKRQRLMKASITGNFSGGIFANDIWVPHRMSNEEERNIITGRSIHDLGMHLGTTIKHGTCFKFIFKFASSSLSNYHSRVF